ncbi:hypothetical protein LTR27_007829 [Elasticomyces elasticus]|nr:hypothetical protein LTR27_007829 [Elasticomyces elasticus]
MAQRALIKLAEDAEDAASGLKVFRDSLPRNATRITAVISEFFGISSSLRQLDSAEADPRYQPSFYRIRDDAGLLLRSLAASIKDVFTMFARSKDRSRQMVWEDLQHKMGQDEGEGLLERLQCYRGVLQAQFDIVTGSRVSVPSESRRQILSLAAAQGVASPVSIRHRTRMLSRLGPRTGLDMYSTVLIQQQHFDNTTCQSARLFTEILAKYSREDISECYGSTDTSAISKMTQDGFLLALQQPFDGDRLWLRIYWRPEDNRARMLVMTKASDGRDQYYCVVLSSLKIIREQSCLKLCRARPDGVYDLWTKLNFAIYERMVLFYCTFVAMKRQDERAVPHPALADSLELKTPDRRGERELFAGVIKHGDMRHALRLFRDRASGGVRLEASAKRGPMQDVPIWTAFITRYAEDPDWPQYEGDGLVSLAAIKPPPYVFLPHYEPPRNRDGEYVLHFVTSDDGKQFVESWVALCRG